MTRQAVYRCFYCQHALRHHRTHGPQRYLWCHPCGQWRLFVRQNARMLAPTWPPAPRPPEAP